MFVLDTTRHRQTTNPPAHAGALENVVLKDDEGRDVRLGDLSPVRLGAIAVHQGRIMGHAAQLGGVLVIAPDGSIRYSHLSDDISDNPPIREVLAAARAIRPHVPIMPSPPGANAGPPPREPS